MRFDRNLFSLIGQRKQGRLGAHRLVLHSSGSRPGRNDPCRSRCGYTRHQSARGAGAGCRGRSSSASAGGASTAKAPRTSCLAGAPAQEAQMRFGNEWQRQGETAFGEGREQGAGIDFRTHRPVAGDGHPPPPPPPPHGARPDPAGRGPCCAICREACARHAASSASRRARPSSRRACLSDDDGIKAMVLADSQVLPALHACRQGAVRRRESRWRCDPGNLQCRWAPCVPVHGPGQGQLPSGSIRPRGKNSPDAPRRHRFANVGGAGGLWKGPRRKLHAAGYNIVRTAQRRAERAPRRDSRARRLRGRRGRAG